MTGLFLALVLSIPLGNMPMGDGWMRYLRNAQVLDTEEWQRWQRWRAPGHALAIHALMPLTGGLVQAARVLSIGATTLLLPATWWLGRLAFGRWPALFGLLLLAGWADLRAMALQTTPYAMVALLLALAAGLCLAALEGRTALGLLAGAVLGLGWGADLRVSGLSLAMAGACALAGVSRGIRWRGPLVAAGLLLVAFPLSQSILHAIPVELFPLSEQVALQRDLNAQFVGGDCFDTQGRMPVLSDLLLDCTRRTAWESLRKLPAWFPLPPLLLALLGVVGLLSPKRQEAWRLLPLLALLLPAIPSLLMVPFFHRYGLLLAAPLAALGGAGLWRICRRLGARWGPVVGVSLLLALGVAWQASSHTLLARIEGRAGHEGAPMPSGLSVGNEVARLVGTLQARAAPTDAISDCAHLDLSLRLYPREVRAPSMPAIPKACPRIYAAGAGSAAVAWLVAPQAALPSLGAWTQEERFEINGGVWLLRATAPSQ